MIGRIVALLLVSFTCFTSSGLAKGPYGSIEVGRWKGGAYTSDANGQFSHCAAGVPYQSGIFFIVGITANFGWSLVFAHQDWNLKQGQKFQIDLLFDGKAQFPVNGTALGEGGAVLVPMPDNSTLINEFRRAKTMAAVAGGQIYRFSLDATAQLLPALVSCVHQAKSGVNLATIRIRPQATTTVPAPRSPEPAPSTAVSSPPPSNDLHFEAVQLATNFLLTSKIQNPQMLKASTSDGTAKWTADEASGFVVVLPGKDGVKGIDVAATMAAADSKSCKGKFATGRVAELVDSEVVFRGFSTCEDGEGIRQAQYFIVPRNKGGFIVFSVAPNLVIQSPDTAKDSKLPEYQRAALTSASR